MTLWGAKTERPLRLAEIAAPLTRATIAIGRLDQRLVQHPLRWAVLHRARLEAVRMMAAADGHVIDPWHLAALVEGLRPRLVGQDALERGTVFDAGRVALEAYQGLVDPDFDLEGQVQDCEVRLAQEDPGLGLILTGAVGLRRWIDGGGTRASGRTALLRFWQQHGVLRMPWPLTGAAMFRAGTPWDSATWLPGFLDALAAEAAAIGVLTTRLEHAWASAHRQTTPQRRTSRTPAAVDILATRSLVSATTLAAALDVSLKSALQILDRLVRDGVAVEVTHRASRRLFGLAGLAPLAESVAPPYRPMPGRKRGRPVQEVVIAEPEPEALPPFPTPSRFERVVFDDEGLRAAMEAADRAIARAREVLK